MRLQQPSHPLLKTAAMLLDRRRHSVADAGGQGADRRTDGPHVGCQGFPLGPSHGSELAEGFLESPLEQRPHPLGCIGRGGRLKADTGQAKKGVDRTGLGDIAFCTERFEVVEIGLELPLVEPAEPRGERAGDIERHLHGAASHLLADHRLDLRLERREALAGPQRKLEEAVVNRADFNTAGVGAIGGHPFAAAGHAQGHA